MDFITFHTSVQCTLKIFTTTPKLKTNPQKYFAQEHFSSGQMLILYSSYELSGEVVHML